MKSDLKWTCWTFLGFFGSPDDDRSVFGLEDEAVEDGDGSASVQQDGRDIPVCDNDGPGL